MNKIFVLTLNWNGSDKLQKLKTGLFKNLENIDIDFEWHIKDNGSKDNSIIMANNWEKTTIHGIGHNRDNFAEGVNYLFDKANPSDEDLVLLLNNDIVFNDDMSLQNMYNLMLKTNSSVVGARLLYSNSNMLQHAGVIFSKNYGLMPYHYKHQEASTDDDKKDRYFQAVTAAVCLIRAKDFKEVGGFDASYFWAFEDIDFVLRVKGNGGKIAYCGSTNIFHEESASLKKNPVNKMFLQKNVSYFKNKWWENSTPKYEIDHEKYLKDSDYNLIK